MKITAEYIKWAYPDCARRFAGDLSLEDPLGNS